MVPGIDPKVDYVFEKVFGSEDQKPVLVSLLNAVLSPAAGEEVAEVILMNPFSEKDAEEDKAIVLDVKARDGKGRWFDVEMQVAAPSRYAARVLYYWASLHASQLSEGEDFDAVRPTVSINFLDSRIFPGARHHRAFRLVDGEGVVLTDHLAIHVIELPKFRLTEEELTTPLDVWCHFLKCGESLDADALPAALDFPEMKRAMEVLRMIGKDTRQREIHEARIRARRDRAAELEDALARGGFIGRIQYSQELLGLPISSREELRETSLEELAALADRLKLQMKSRS